MVPSPRDDAPRIHEFQDYRAWLRAWFEARAGRPSQRSFARRVHCAPSLVSSIVNGHRTLSLDRAELWADALGLEPAERRHFLAMVTLAEGEGEDQRDRASEEVEAGKRFHTARRLTEESWALLSRWYVGAILELAGTQGWLADPEWIAATLFPPIQPQQAAEALGTLERLGALVRDPQGRLVASEAIWSTGHEANKPAVSMALSSLHHSVLDLARHALDEVPADQRHYGTLTFSLSDELVDELKSELKRFQEAIIARVVGAKGPRHRVWHLGMQFFPMSRS